MTERDKIANVLNSTERITKLITSGRYFGGKEQYQ